MRFLPVVSYIVFFRVKPHSHGKALVESCGGSFVFEAAAAHVGFVD